MPQITEEALLVYVESRANSNKFYRLRLMDDGTVHKLWGRVREGEELTGQSQVEGGGRQKFDSIYAAKTKKGYSKVNLVQPADVNSGRAVAAAQLRETASVSLAGGSTDKVVTTLVDRLVAANKHDLIQSTGGMISVDTSGQARTALGIISEDAITEARDLLGQMAATTGGRRAALTEQYLRLVPHHIHVGLGAGWAETWLGQHTTVERQRDLLDALAASANYAKAAQANAAKSKVAGNIDEDFFRYRVHRLDETSDEYQVVRERYNATKQSVHTSSSLTPKYIFSLEDRRHGKDIEATQKKLRNVQRLWHGTGAANVLSILQRGLFVPPRSGSGIHIAGRMFGDGIYLSRSASKSLNYSTGFWGGGRAASTFMFLTHTAMGYEYRPNSSPGFNSFQMPEKDSAGKAYNSINALPDLIPALRNHEAIVPDPMQVQLSYLVEF